MGDRRSDIVAATNEALKYTAFWLQHLHPQDAPILPDRVQLALRNMVLVCNEGDIPESCRDLYIAIQRFAEEFAAYARDDMDKRNPNGSPLPTFWGALRNVEEINGKTDTVHLVQLESVAELRAQKVSDEQIAAHIYGNRGSGPFMQDGFMNKRLLDRAAKSDADLDEILKDSGWPCINGAYYPPWLSNANTSKMKETKDRIKAYQILENGQQKLEDARTIEEMLLEGIYIQVIQKYKRGATREKILQIAEELRIVAVDQPGSAVERVIKAENFIKAGDLPMNYNQHLQEGTETELKQAPPAPPVERLPSMPDIPPMNNGQDAFSTDEAGIDATGMSSLADLSMAETAIKSCLHGNPAYGPPEVINDLAEDGINVTEEQVAHVMKTLDKSVMPTQRPAKRR